MLRVWEGLQVWELYSQVRQCVEREGGVEGVGAVLPGEESEGTEAVETRAY